MAANEQPSSAASSASPSFILGVGQSESDLYSNINKAGGERGDSGVDLRIPETVSIPPIHETDGMPHILNLRVRARHLSVDGKYVAYMLVPRSSIGKTPLGLANSIGIIDAGYTGELKVAIRNHSNAAWRLVRGESLFQLVRADLAPSTVSIVGAESEEFVGTKRGAGGFGSTGAAGAGIGSEVDKK